MEHTVFLFFYIYFVYVCVACQCMFMRKGDAWHMKPCVDLEEATHSETVDWAVPRTHAQAKVIPANLNGSILILGTGCTCTNEH